MPYTTEEPPERIKGLPKHAQEIWIAAFNAALEEYADEEKANATAWAAVKEQYEQDENGKWRKKKTENARAIQRGEIIALAVGDDDKPTAGKRITIQVLRAGDFTDLSGREFTLSNDDMSAYIRNSNARLKTEQVPVELGHPDDPGSPAAAWYTRFFKKVIDGVEWVCAEIELTALGAQSLADKLYKYFSANLWLDDKIICGGGFVNRPAVSGQQPVGSLSQYLQPREQTTLASPTDRGGEQLMSNQNPIQILVNGFKHLLAQLEMSHEDRNMKLRAALQEKFGKPSSGDTQAVYVYPVATFDDRVIIQVDGKYVQVTYSFNAEGACEFGEPSEVEIEWKPKTQAAQMGASATPNAPAISNLPAPAQAIQSQGGESNMTQPTTNLDANAVPVANATPVSSAPLNAPIPQIVLPVAQPDPTASAAEQIAQVRREAQLAAEQQVREFQTMLAEERKRATEAAQAQMARQQKVAALSVQLTTGRRQFPYRAEELEAILGKLSDADRDLIEPVLVKLHEAGLVEMGERGSSAPGRGVKELPAYAKPLLTAWLAKKGTISEFFAACPELGKAEQYDLYEFENK